MFEESYVFFFYGTNIWFDTGIKGCDQNLRRDFDIAEIFCYVCRFFWTRFRGLRYWWSLGEKWIWIREGEIGASISLRKSNKVRFPSQAVQNQTLWLDEAIDIEGFGGLIDVA
jgi:hypothetical protein